MRFLVVLCCWMLPTVAMAQAHYVDLDTMSHDEESRVATSLYVIGGAVLTLGALATVGLSLASVDAGLDFGSPTAHDSSMALQNGAIAAGCIGGVIGLVLIGIAIRFDVDSASRGSELTTWWLE